MPLQFPPDFKALVIGAHGALGQAFVQYLTESMHCADVVAVTRTATRSGEFSIDLQDQNSIEALAKNLAESAPFHFIVDATGALTIDGIGPEKSLAMLQEDALMRSFAINTIGPALLLKHLAPLLAKGDAIYAKLSARVGSITDNQKGGWYGYRASKAAMNMVLQSAAIELQRRNAQLRIVALQPGTVRSKLSEPFAANVPLLLEPDESVAGMMQAMLTLEPRAGAVFIDYRGEEIPW